MLERLELHNVGPAPEMTLDVAKRVNLVTGDNGLGKSFLLDVAWWALTRRWPREVNRRMTSGHSARPRDASSSSTIRFRVRGRSGPLDWEAEFSRREQSWIGKPGRPALPGIVVYAHADGSFSVWDPARNYWSEPGDIATKERRPAYVFTEAEVWDGLRDTVDGRLTPVCNGLLYDWSRWIQADDANAIRMALALLMLSPPTRPGQSTKRHAITPGLPMRLSVDDSRDIPSIKTPYTGQVPIIHASSGIRRIVALAYMLTWTWSEHQIASELRGDQPTRKLVMLVDEVESHLHPRWQRSILSSMRALGSVLVNDVDLQLVVSTHSPLVLASAEPWFDPELDAWFDLELEDEPPQARLHRRTYTPHGTAGSWLTSEAFNLPTDRSLEAEQAILRAREVLRQTEMPLEEVMTVHAELRAALPDIDRFWVRWNAFVESRGGNP